MEKDKELMRHKRRKEKERRDKVNVSRSGGLRCVTCIDAARSCDARGE